MADVVAILFSEFVVGYLPTLETAAPKRERFVDGHANSLFVGHAYSRRVAPLDMYINQLAPTSNSQLTLPTNLQE